MSVRMLPHSVDAPLGTILGSCERRSVASYECELTVRRHTENRLRRALVKNRALLRQKDELIQNERLLSRESDHRLFNGLQIIVAQLSLQSWASADAGLASQLAAAANRVAMIARLHRSLHCLDGLQAVAFKQYLEELCREFAVILSVEEGAEQALVFEGVEITLSPVTAIPLGFIVSELITNAVKYGNGRIAVRLESNPGNGYALSVSNDGPGLPEGFDPIAGNGLGMRIVLALVKQIGGELRIGRGDNNQGARFTVQLS